MNEEYTGHTIYLHETRLHEMYSSYTFKRKFAQWHAAVLRYKAS